LQHARCSAKILRLRFPGAAYEGKAGSGQERFRRSVMPQSQVPMQPESRLPSSAMPCWTVCQIMDKKEPAPSDTRYGVPNRVGQARITGNNPTFFCKITPCAPGSVNDKKSEKTHLGESHKQKRSFFVDF